MKGWVMYGMFVPLRFWSQPEGHLSHPCERGERRPHPGDAVDTGQGARGRVAVRAAGPPRPPGEVLAGTAAREEGVSPGGGEFGGDGGGSNYTENAG